MDFVLAKEKLITENLSLIIFDKEVEFVSEDAGIRPILAALANGSLRNKFVIDKIIGKAAALCIIYGGAKACFGLTMSRSAIEVFEKHKFDYKYDNLIARVENRTKTGLCPLEELVADINYPQKGYESIKAKVGG